MRYIGFLIIVFGLTACIKLNDIAFYNETITDYLLDDYNTDRL